MSNGNMPQVESLEVRRLFVSGTAGNDVNAGNDVLVGGGGLGGRDTLIGGGGNDRMFGGPDAADKILGGIGTDSAALDDKDVYDLVEVLL